MNINQTETFIYIFIKAKESSDHKDAEVTEDCYFEREVESASCAHLVPPAATAQSYTPHEVIGRDDNEKISNEGENS